MRQTVRKVTSSAQRSCLENVFYSPSTITIKYVARRSPLEFYTTQLKHKRSLVEKRNWPTHDVSTATEVYLCIWRRERCIIRVFVIEELD